MRRIMVRVVAVLAAAMFVLGINSVAHAQQAATRPSPYVVGDIEVYTCYPVLWMDLCVRDY
jgi:hypothetical protein